MSSTLKLQFLTRAGDRMFINIANAAPVISSSDISDLMDGIITKNIFSTKSGDLTAKVRAEILTTEVQNFNFETEEEI